MTASISASKRKRRRYELSPSEIARQQVLEEWRLLPEPGDILKHCVKASDVLMRVLDGLSFEEELSRVLALWKELVGDFLAEHSQPTALNDGVLLVQVVQPTLRYELERTLKPELLRRLQEALGSRFIKEIRFR